MSFPRFRFSQISGVRSPIGARKSEGSRWTISVLERRLLLAGDLAAAVPVADSDSSQSLAADVAAPSADESATVATKPIEIAFIDTSVEVGNELASLADRGVEIAMIDASADPIDQISRYLSGRTGVGAVHVFSHGRAGQIQLGGLVVNSDLLSARSASVMSWRSALAEDADILIYGCDVAAGRTGHAFIEQLALLSGANVAASTDRTGSTDRGGDWDLEATIGTIDTPLFASQERLESLDVTLPISIRAAGNENDEQMQLQIDGVTVQTWNNIGGNAYGGIFQTYTYNGGAGVTADRVRVAFTNDLYLPAQNIDRNLRVDSITVNGTTFESEDPTVFGTGTWLPADGVQPGFRESEFINSNGYFQYADNSTPPPPPPPPPPTGSSTIEIFAAGNENSETMQLWIAGTRVATWNNVGGNADARQFVSHTYTSAQKIASQDVQIRFTNDLYNPAAGVDRNLRVDRIVIDGATQQTESPNVYSTGTWQNGSVTPGFKQDETLHVNGYFQFAATTTTPPNPGVLSLTTSNLTVSESAGFIDVEVHRTGGSDGQASVNYQTQPGTATAGLDYTAKQGTLIFANGQTTASIRIPILADTIAEATETFIVTIDDAVGAGLLAPRTATIAIVDSAVPLPTYSNFASVSGLTLNGSASNVGNTLQLTPDANTQAGSAFFTTPISLASDPSFRSAFSFQLTGETGGADGFTFVIQNDPRGVAAIGATGGDLGFTGITKSVAVEFDTYVNGGFDPSNNHISIISGNVNNPLTTTLSPVDLNSGDTFYAWVDYHGGTHSLSVYLSTDPTKPAFALTKTNVDLSTVVGTNAYVGFTAGTGGLANAQLIRSWTLDQQTPDPDPPVTPPDTLVANNIVTGLLGPTAIEWLPDGTMLIAEQRGVVRTAVGSTLSSTPFIDISAMVNSARDRGLLDIAVHPDFVNNPYVYLLFTYDPPEVNGYAAGTLGGLDGFGNRAGRLVRVTADAATNYRTVVPGSEVILLGNNSTWANFNGLANSTSDFAEPPAGELLDGTFLRDFINSDSESHSVGALEFGNNGELFVSIGDGASYNQVDVRADRVQSIDSLSGKVLRIDPITGQGLAENPFFDGDVNSNRSKVYQLGLRNPFRIAVDPQSGQLYVGDVGWFRWEEIDSAGPGANFGWPFYEGGNGDSIINTGYQNTPEGQAFFAAGVTVEPSIYALSHQLDGINAIVVGDVYQGTAYGPQYRGDLFFNDLGQGIVRHASIGPDGKFTDVGIFTTGANVVVAISEGPDGFLYYVDLDGSFVGRWELV